MKRARRGMLASVGALFLMCACSKEERVDRPTSPPSLPTTDASAAAHGVGASPPASTAIPATTPPSAATPAAPPPSPAPVGVATLVLEHVSADCGGGGGWAGTKERVHSLGTDVLLIVNGDDPTEKPRRDFAFCPSRLPDAGPLKPQLSLWQYCRAFPSCRIVSSDAGSDNRVEVQCGKENVVLESDGTRTILRGSFGEREVAPHSMKIAPVKKQERHAMVDC